METRRFDAWTRRRFGLGVSGLAAGLLGTATGGAALDRDPKRKRKKHGKGKGNGNGNATNPSPACPQVDTCPQRACCECDTPK